MVRSSMNRLPLCLQCSVETYYGYNVLEEGMEVHVAKSSCRVWIYIKNILFFAFSFFVDLIEFDILLVLMRRITAESSPLIQSSASALD